MPEPHYFCGTERFPEDKWCPPEGLSQLRQIKVPGNLCQTQQCCQGNEPYLDQHLLDIPDLGFFTLFRWSCFFPKARQGAGVGLVMQRLVWAALLGQMEHIWEGQHEALQFVSPKQRVI